MTKTWMSSWIWGLRPISAALLTVILVVAVGPWGLIAAWPLAIILPVGVIRHVQSRRHPVDTEIRRISDELWAAESAQRAQDPRLDDITASLKVRRAPRRLRSRP